MSTETQEKKAIAKAPVTLKEILGDPRTKSRFNEILGKRAAGFISSILAATHNSKALSECEPHSIVSAAAMAASLDLPISGALGAAAMVPYRDNGKPVAQFQIMRNGWVQLAQRTGQYALLNATQVYEGQLVGQDPFTGSYKFDEGKKTSDKVIGYVAYFKLTNGFEKYLYMTVAEITAHGKRFSKSYDKENGMWKKDFHSMALKTVIKRLISKWGPVSIDSPLAKAITVDQAAIKEDGTPDYIDSTTVPEKEETVYEQPQPKEEAKAEQATTAPAPAKEKEILFTFERIASTSVGDLECQVLTGDEGKTKVYVAAEDLVKKAKKLKAGEKVNALVGTVDERLWAKSLVVVA